MAQDPPAALRAALDNPPGFLNANPPGFEAGCLDYAIYHSQLAFVRTLLELGAEANYPEHAGFP